MRSIDARNTDAERPGRNAKAFTMLELMVTAGVLAILMLATARIIVQAQRVVSKSQELMRLNAQAAAVSRALRADIRPETKHGFLCITAANDGTPMLLASATRISYSADMINASFDSRATAAIVGLGLCDDGYGGKIFWRGQWLCNEALFGGGQPIVIDAFIAAVGGRWVLDLGDVSSCDDSKINELVSYVIAKPLVPQKITVPVQTLEDVRNVWQVLATDCTGLSIQWTYGARNSNNELVWMAPNAGQRALWTKSAPGNWPVAVRFTFSARDRMVKRPPLTYSVICPVGQ